MSVRDDPKTLIDRFIGAVREELSADEHESDVVEYAGYENQWRVAGLGVYNNSETGEMFVVAGGHPYRNQNLPYAIDETSELFRCRFGEGPAILDSPHPSWACSITGQIHEPEIYAAWLVTDRRGNVRFPPVSEAADHIYDGYHMQRYMKETQVQDACRERFHKMVPVLEDYTEARIRQVVTDNVIRPFGYDGLAELLERALSQIFLEVAQETGILISDDEHELGSTNIFEPCLHIEGSLSKWSYPISSGGGWPHKICVAVGFHTHYPTQQDNMGEYSQADQSTHFVFCDYTFFGDGCDRDYLSELSDAELKSPATSEIHSFLRELIGTVSGVADNGFDKYYLNVFEESDIVSARFNKQALLCISETFEQAIKGWSLPD